jgi:flagellar hook-basal body complex protein FliE
MTSPVGSSQIESILSQIRNSSAVVKPTVVKPADVTNPASTTKIDFASALRAQLDQLNSIEQNSVSLGQKFALGDTRVNLSDVMIASQKASIAIQTSVQVRNKVVAAYQSIMNMQI